MKPQHVLIVSDTHSKDIVYYQVVKKEAPLTMVVHAVDAEGQDDRLAAICRVPFYCVRGNNDFFSDLPSDLEFYIGDVKTFLTHGHHYYCSFTEADMIDEARRRSCKILIYGHTHRPTAHFTDGILVLNPGSLTYPRQYDHRPSYILLDIDEHGTPSAEIRYV